jgi:hypothetical protein
MERGFVLLGDSLVKINFALIVVAMLAVTSSGVRGQEPLTPESFGEGDMPPALRIMEDEPTDPARAADEGTANAELMPEPLAEEIETGEFLEGSILGESMQFLGACPPEFESSGTWLQRGFWYTEVDYVMLNRGWDRKGMQFAFETTSGVVPAPETPGGQGLVVGTNELRIRGERPGAEGFGRVTLGRFLFRDADNRDHSTELSWLGGGKYNQNASLQATTNNGLQIPEYIDRVNPSFDGARSIGFDYETEVNTVELNYKVKQRMQRDQMVLHPDGQWIRKASPSRTYQYLAGIRYYNQRENLDVNAVDIPVTAALDEDGRYHIETENNMLGLQFGGALSRETARWSITGSAKLGPMWNRTSLDSNFQVGETTILSSGVTESSEDDLSFVGDFQLLGKWHLRPNLSLRVGLECLFVDSIALAPFQLNFIPGGFKPIAGSGDSVFLGTSLGVESYW